MENKGQKKHLKTAALQSLGCRLNHAETNLLRLQLEEAGYRIIPWEEGADLCVVNSCTVTMQADAKSRQVLRAARRQNPDTRVVVTGCFAQLNADMLADKGLADIVLGNGDKLNLIEHLKQADEPGREQEPYVFAPPMGREPFVVPGLPKSQASVSPGHVSSVPVSPPPKLQQGQEEGGAEPPLSPFALLDGGTRAHLKVQDGCDFMCSFCVIPFARGRARARDFSDLLDEARLLAEGGVREVVLTGVNLGTYQNTSLSGEKSLTDVVDALSAIPGVARVRISSIEPTTVDVGLLERMADPAHALVPFLHLPLQSGSPGVLRAMRRRYEAADYLDFARLALDTVPDLCLGADVMAGFPGETDAQFDDTLSLLQALPFAYFHVFPYSPRKGTQALRIEEPVQDKVKQRRAALLRELSRRKQLAFHQRFVGSTLEVLFEKPAMAQGIVENTGQYTVQGYTDNYIKVAVTVKNGKTAANLRNQLLPVILREAGTERVAGQLVDEL